DHSSHNGNDGRPQNPATGELHRHGGNSMADAARSNQTQDDAHKNSSHSQYQRFAEYDSHDIPFGRAQRFENSNFPRAFHYGCVHGLENDEEADYHGNANYDIDKR